MKKPSKKKPSNQDEFRFYASHRPKFEAGDYKLEVTLPEAEHSSKFWTAPTSNPSRTALFSIIGDRFSLHPALLRSSYPPPSGRADYQGVLPHLIFHRSTLPWERSPAGNAMDNPPAWLALLAFKDEEIPPIHTVRVSDLTAVHPASPGPHWQKFAPEHCDDKDAAVSVIELAWKDLQPAAPTWEELPWLAHVRTVQFRGGANDTTPVAGDDADALDGGDSSEAETPGNPDSEECAVLVAQRLILAAEKPERWAVHLISLEGAYDASTAFHPSQATTLNANDQVRLVSLFHWEFVAQPKEPDFDETIENLDGLTGTKSPTCTPFALALKADQAAEEARPAIQTLVQLGSVPLPHHLRDGQSLVSWYRGPLVSWTGSAGSALSPVVRFALPVRSSDSLALYFEHARMFDLSYSVAWELGRMTALANREFAVGISDWKRARARYAGRLRRDLDTDLLPRSSATAGAPTRAVSQLPPLLSGFLRGLATLQSVPAAHLVAHDSLLPAESLRFVRIDPTWVECLLDGALSLGRHSLYEAGRDSRIPRHVPPGMMGLLLRTCLVDLHPDMEIHGWESNPAVAPDAQAVSVITDRKLGPGVRLLLFASPPAFLSIGLPPTVLHFGVEVTNEGQLLCANDQHLNFGAPGANGRISLCDLANKILAPEKDPPANDVNVDRVVAKLMESAPRVTFPLQSISNSVPGGSV